MSDSSASSDGRLSERNSPNRPVFNRTTAQGEWDRRIARAEELGAKYNFAAEILRFYVAVARFQKDFSTELGAGKGSVQAEPDSFAHPFPPELARRFRDFISVVERNGPTPLRKAAGELRNSSDDSHSQLLTSFW